MRILKISLILLALLNVSAVSAQNETHKKAAEKLLELVNSQNNFNAVMDQIVELQIKQQPALASYKDAIKKFYSKYISFEALKPEIVSIYLQEFTEKELLDTITFYETPAGKKIIQKLPSISKRGGELGMTRVQQNIGELQKMINEEAQRQGKAMPFPPQAQAQAQPQTKGNAAPTKK